MIHNQRMNKSIIYPLIVIGTLFFVFGFLTWANGVLIPYFRVGLDLNNFQSTWVVSSAYLAYFVMAIPSASILKRTGYKKGMFIGLLVMALGTLLFVPAAYMQAYWLFLTGLFITGTGLALLQTAANPYIAVIGPIESTARRIGFMGLANKIAGLIALAALGSLFLADADEVVNLVAQANAEEKAVILGNYMLAVVNPYLVITGILLVLAFMILYSKLPEVDEESSATASVAPKSTKTNEANRTGEKRSVLQFPNLVFGVVALFFSSACEVIPIDGIILYSSALGIPIGESRFFAQYTLIAMTLGYVASIFLIPKYLSQQSALMACAVWGILMTIGAYMTDGILSVSFVISMGFSSAMLWGTIWGLALTGLGRFTKMGSALLLMSVVGGGIFPVIFGRLMDINLGHPQNAMILLIPCNLVLLAYAVWMQRRFTYSTVGLLGVLTCTLILSCGSPSHHTSDSADEGDKSPSADYIAEVRDLVQHDVIQSSFEMIDSLNAETRQYQIYLNEIPAPPFQEHERAKEFARLMAAHGADSTWIDSIGNVRALRKGTDNSAGTVVIDAHLDTVFPEDTDVRVVHRGDTLYAPGISDNARSLAMLITLLNTISTHDLRTSSDLLFVGTVGEEGEGDLRGVKHLFEDLEHVRSFISLDIGALGVIVNQGIGSLRYKVTMEGPGGHSFGDFGVVSPHFTMMSALSDWHQKVDAYRKNTADRITYNLGVIGGGTSVNSIPYESWAILDTRAEKSEHLQKMGELLQASLEQSTGQANSLKVKGEDLRVRIDTIGNRPPGLTPVDSPIVQRALAALDIVNCAPVLRASSTNSNTPMAHGVPAITLGQGGKGGGAHSLNEWWLDENGDDAIKYALLVVISEAQLAI